MHVAIYLSNKSPPDQKAAIDIKIGEAFKPYSTVTPFPDCYIVKVAGEADRMALSKALIEVSQSVGNTILFVITPLMANGKYQGFLPTTYWEALNKQTE